MKSPSLNNLENSFLELSQDLMCVAGFDGFFKYVNPAFEKLLGYTEKEFLSKPFLDFIHPDDHGKNDKEVANLTKGESTLNFENRYICKDGSIKYIHWTATPKVDEKLMQCVGRDITARKQAEVLIMQSNANLNALTENTNDFIWSIDRDYKLLTANSEFLAYAKPLYKKEIAIGSLLLDKKVLPPELYEEWKERYDRTLAGNKFKTELETFTRPDRKKYLELNYNPIINDKNEITGVSILGRDITESKQAELEIVENHALLKKQNEELQKAKERAEESEEKYRQLYESNLMPISIFDVETLEFLSVNNAFIEKYGYTEEEFLKMTILDIRPESEFEKLKQSVSIKDKGLENRGVFFHKKKNGEIIQVEIIRYDLVFKGRNAKLVFVNDISELKQSQIELLKAKEIAEESGVMFRKMIEHMPNGVAIYQPIENSNDFVFLEVNKRAEIITNTSNKELIGCTLLQSFPNMINSPLQKALLKVKKTGKSVYLSPFYYKDNEREGWRENNIYKLPSGEIIAIFTDVTELKKAELELIAAKEKAEENEAKFKTVFKESNSVQLLIEPDTGKIIDANQAACNFYGYSFTKLTSLKIQNINQLPENKIEDEMLNAKNRKLNYFEFKHKLSNGTIKDVEVYANPIVIDNKTVLISIIHDISARKLAEQELTKAKAKAEESETKFKAAFYTNPDAININKMDGEYVEINEGFTRLTGFTKDDIIGKLSSEINIWSIPKDRVKLSNALQKFGIIENLESIFKSKDGRLIPALMSARIITLKNELHILSVTRDITERKKLEKTKDILVAISNEILTTNDLEEFFHHIFIELRKIIETNNFYIALYDEQSEMISTPYIADKLDTSITSFPAKRTLTGHVIETKKSMLINQADFYELDKSGVVDLVGPPSDVWIGVPLFSEEKVIGVIVIQNYEGEKRLSKEDLSLLEYVAPQISLAIERKKVVEDLKNALGKAQESDRLKSAFLANMSHEIRTPMNGILGFTELLKEPGLSGEEQEKYISIIESSGDRMLNTIHDIIDISKIEAGQVGLDYSNINLNNQLDELFDFFLPEAKKKDIQLSVTKSFTDQYASIKTDKDKLNSILTNLIKNAIKFIDSGKIEFGYLINEKAKQPELQFYVKDTGAGIPKEKQNTIFNRFVQADNESTRVYEGSGLGLAISKAYVEMLKGKIWLESEEGLGTKFYFTHPYHVNKNHKKNIANLSKAKTEKKALKILIAEDDEFSIEFLVISLKDYCKEILIAKTGIEAVDMCCQNPDLDLIMMDIRLPEITGYEATKRIRKFNKEVFILAQTAFAIAGDEEKCKAVGCDDYITKPIKKERLFKIISDNF